MSTTDNVNIWVKLRGAKQAAGEFKILGHEINDIGDEAAKASRKIAKLNAASASTRLNIGPMSTSMRGGVLAVGALTLGVQKFTPALLGAAEATATLVGGAGAAGGQGLLALAQGSLVARLGLGGLMDALGGNEKAAKNLAPELQDLFATLSEHRDTLRQTAQDGLVPGLEKGSRAALRNFGALDRVVGMTAKTLGGLGEDAGMWLGDPQVGRDAVTVGRANAHVLDNLGHSALNLADAARHVLVEASPLTEWMSDSILRGTELADTWALNARNSGEMAKFFREARTDLSLLASIGGHSGRGIINLFGSQDVDGTKTLQSLDHITKRFEDWSNSPAVRHSLGDAIVAEIPDAVAAAMDAIAENLPASAGHAALVFWHSFWDADVSGKALMAAIAAGKLGAFKQLGKLIRGGGDKGGGTGGLLGGRGSTPANPLYVMDVTGLPGNPRNPVNPKDPVITRGSTQAERQATKDWVNGRKPSRVGWLRNGIRTGAAGVGLFAAPEIALPLLGAMMLSDAVGDAVIPPYQQGLPRDPRFRGGRGGLSPAVSRVSETELNGPISPFNFGQPFNVILQVEGREIARANVHGNSDTRARQGRWP